MRVFVYAPFGKFNDNIFSDAYIGAISKGLEVHLFTDIDEVPRERDIMVVAYVEDTLKWFNRNIYSLDKNYEMTRFMKSRSTKIETVAGFVNNYEFKTKMFIKPYEDVKLFTGFVTESKDEIIKMYQDGTLTNETLLSIQDFIDFESEYRVYINNANIIGVKHYLGSPYKAISEEVVKRMVIDIEKEINAKSYTLDVGVSGDKTILIEINDAWSIGNYGLSPDKYFHFLADRWHQLIGMYF